MRLTGLTLPILLGALLIQVVIAGKAGLCPMSPTLCLENLKKDCENDQNCNGTQKCCRDGCNVLCTDPEVIKTGVCPKSLKPATSCQKIPLKNRNCTEDRNCNGTQKCCLYDCQYSCKDPIVTKPGVCPKPPTSCSTKLRFVCGSDENCNGTQKCCWDGCNYSCTDPAVMTQRVCPLSLEPCSEKIKWGCMKDENCVGTQKCCRDGCKFSCTDPAVIKPGKCPKFPTPPTSCPAVIPMEGRHCTGDQHCNGTQKCCLHDCQYQCKDPAEMTPGKCPEGPIPLSACPPWKHQGFCESDLNCEGGKKCCLFDCQYTCKYLIDSDGRVLPQFYKKEEKNLFASSQ